MQALNEEHDGINRALTSTLIRTILESRRALRMALSMMHEMMQAGTAMDWPDESAAPVERPATFPRTPNLQVSSGTAAFAFSKRKSSHRTPLRLVSPFRHDSPLVMPDNARFSHDDEPPDDHERDRDRDRHESREGKESDSNR